MTLLSHAIEFLLWLGCTTCEEKPCDYPDIENGKLSWSLEYHRNYYFPMTFGQHADYHCNNGYSTPTGEHWVRMVCSETGWSPEPKCLRICHVRHLKYGYYASSRKTVYKEGEKVRYVCNDDYHPEREDGVVTCTKDNWSPPPRCIRKKKCQNISFDNGYFIVGKKTFRLQEKVTYHCLTGFVTPEGQERGVIECQDNGWTPPPKCIREGSKCGPPPVIENGDLLSFPKKEYPEGTTLEYKCPSLYVLEGSQYITCTDGQWTSPPVCLEKCQNISFDNGYFTVGKKTFRLQEKVTYHCLTGFVTPEGQETGVIECQDNGWTPPPKCIREGSKCGPPPVIENGDLLSFPKKEYPEGTTLEYKCPSLYVLEGSQYITCTDGQWTSPPVCLVACTASEEDMGRNNIELKWARGSKLYSRSGDFVEFKCKRGYLEDPASAPFRVQCMEGTLEYPHCKPGRNCTVHERSMERNHIKLQSSSWSRTSTYLSGDYILFECKWWYRAVSQPEHFRAECRDGVIRYPTCEYVFG